MIGAVGNDPFGETARDVLALEGRRRDPRRHRSRQRHRCRADRGRCRRARTRSRWLRAPTRDLTPDHVESSLSSLGAQVGGVLASLEVPLDAVHAAGRWCRSRSLPFVLNPAPARPEVHDLLPYATHITPNGSEILIVAAQAEEPRGAVARLTAAYPDLTVISTVGAAGAVAGGPEGPMRVAGLKVRAARHHRRGRLLQRGAGRGRCWNHGHCPTRSGGHVWRHRCRSGSSARADGMPSRDEMRSGAADRSRA